MKKKRYISLLYIHYLQEKNIEKKVLRCLNEEESYYNYRYEGLF